MSVKVEQMNIRENHYNFELRGWFMATFEMRKTALESDSKTGLEACEFNK